MEDTTMHTTLGAWLWMAIWIVALLVMVWALVAGGRGAQAESPSAILRRRYAAGDISEDEFRHARDVLGTGDSR